VLPLARGRARAAWGNRTLRLRPSAPPLLATRDRVGVALLAGVGLAALVDFLATGTSRLVSPLWCVADDTGACHRADPGHLVRLRDGFPRVSIVGLCLLLSAHHKHCRWPGVFRTLKLDRYCSGQWGPTGDRLADGPSASALPAFFTGLRMAVTYSVVAATHGEWVGGSPGWGCTCFAPRTRCDRPVCSPAMLVTSLSA